MNNTADRLYDLLPSIYRIRDAEQGGALKDFISVIAEQVEALEENLAQSYDDHFVETCADWVIPYIGDLIGYRTLHGVVPKIASQRAEVANTIGFRRRKGTASMLEQLARDVTDWNARVVEFFELLATNQYINHLRLHNQVTPDLRQWEPLERLDTAFDSVPHTVNVRRISTEKGKHNIPNIGIFLWRLNDYSLTKSPAVQIDDNRFMFSPSGNNTPLFTCPDPEDEITHIAEPINVPEPISRRVLDAYLEDYYGTGKSLVLRTGLGDDSEVIESDQISACNLSDIEEQRIQISGHNDGQYTLRFNEQDTESIDHDASPSDIQTALEGLDTISVGDITVTGTVTDTDVDVTVSFYNTDIDAATSLIIVDVEDLIPSEGTTETVIKNWAHQPLNRIAIDPVLGRIAFPQSETTQDDVRVDFNYGFSADMAGGEYERRATFDKDLEMIAEIADGDSIQNSLDSTTESGAIQINSSGRFEDSLSVGLGASQRLELRARNGNRPTIVLNSNLSLIGEQESEIILNGLLITGGGLFIPSENNSISKVTLRHCTLVPGLALTIDGEPLQPETPSLIVEMENVTVVIDHCIIGSIRSDRGATIEINDSIVDATASTNFAFTSEPVNNNNPGGILEIINSTVIGRVFASAISLASNVIFFSEALDEDEAPVRAADKQTGCVRFSYVPPNSVVPRRYRCQPDMAVKEAIASVEKKQIFPVSEQQRQSISNGVRARIRPGFNDLGYGRPAYCQLRHSTPIEIRTGADDESEMGVFHQVYQPQRETNLRIRLDEYLRFGLEAGFFYEN